MDKATSKHRYTLISKYFDKNCYLIADMCAKCYEEHTDVRIVGVNTTFLQIHGLNALNEEPPNKVQKFETNCENWTNLLSSVKPDTKSSDAVNGITMRMKVEVLPKLKYVQEVSHDLNLNVHFPSDKKKTFREGSQHIRQATSNSQNIDSKTKSYSKEFIDSSMIHLKQTSGIETVSTESLATLESFKETQICNIKLVPIKISNSQQTPYMLACTTKDLETSEEWIETDINFTNRLATSKDFKEIHRWKTNLENNSSIKLLNSKKIPGIKACITKCQETQEDMNNDEQIASKNLATSEGFKETQISISLETESSINWRNLKHIPEIPIYNSYLLAKRHLATLVENTEKDSNFKKTISVGQNKFSDDLSICNTNVIHPNEAMLDCKQTLKKLLDLENAETPNHTLESTLPYDSKLTIKTMPDFKHNYEPTHISKINTTCLSIFCNKTSTRRPWKPPKSPHNLIEESLYENPWKLLVATIFLNKTSCYQAKPYIDQFLSDFDTPEDVLRTTPVALEKYFVNIGLTKRSVQLWRMSHDFLHKNWTDVRQLYGIGKYGSDAYEMFCRGNFNVEPSDRFLKIYKAWYEMMEKEAGICANCRK